MIDANVILRFVLEDHPDLTARASALFDRAAGGEVQLIIPPAILAECFYALKSFYKLPRAEIAGGLLKVLALPGVGALEEQAVTEALRLLKEQSVDFADAYLAALGRTLALPVASFDSDLRKLGADVLDD
ncbi:PIN domain-containing protein [Deinococcus metallilatus]|uniref:Nucleic acid-binding protein n=1 Tax=Deinococcus metallilatus TaxID=1211322 RepID=A0ABR6MWA2_9DEIO|nr:PIN domain-containing protein [Deinococcus metallilatus]MBB5296219.1 putative nucleic acid-binding protein [Deinococcus metallilatus]